MSNVRSGMMIAGKYRLQEALARGGMGSVWRARHVMLDTPVAIKFIGAEVFALQEARRRFEREAKAAAMLQSPHVVRIHDYGLEGNVPYLVMELLVGEDLGACLKRRGKLPPEETASIVFQVARALRRAAEAGIVHRDLKPSNVFLLRDEDDEELVKVLDFGVAKAPRELKLDDESTRNGAIIGSPRYMSPEQARGSPLVDPRSDLWSLAVIAYRCLTGELPFQSLDMPDLIVKICSEDPAPPSEIDPALGPEVDAFFERALQKDPSARYQTARELASAFADAAGLPPPSVTSRRLMVRHPSGQLRLSDVLAASPPPPDPKPAPRAAERSPSEAGASARSARSRVGPARAAAGKAHAGAAGNAALAVGHEPEAETPAAPCERTRISGRPPPPVPGNDTTRSSGSVLAKGSRSGTPTPYPSGIDLPPAARTARPPRLVARRRVAAGAGILALLFAGLGLVFPWRRSTPGPSPAGVASPEAAAAAVSLTDAPGLAPQAIPPPPAPVAPLAEPIETGGDPRTPASPIPAAAARTAPPPPSVEASSTSPFAAPSASAHPAPAVSAPRPGARKKHAILGI